MDNIETSKKIIAALAGIQKEVLAGCGCGGSGIIGAEGPTLAMMDNILGHPHYTESVEPNVLEGIPDPCPDCAEVRGLDLCWHRPRILKISVRRDRTYNCHICEGARFMTDDVDLTSEQLSECCNPDLTTAMHGSKLWLVHCLMVLGEWEKFVLNVNPISPTLSCHMGGAYELSAKEILKLANILTDGEKLVPEVEAWIKGRKV